MVLNRTLEQAQDEWETGNVKDFAESTWDTINYTVTVGSAIISTVEGIEFICAAGLAAKGWYDNKFKSSSTTNYDSDGTGGTNTGGTNPNAADDESGGTNTGVTNPNATPLPKNRTELHEELLSRGYRCNGTSSGGYVTYYGPDGTRVDIRPNGEIICTQKEWLPDHSKKIAMRYYWDGTPVPDGGHNTNQFVEEIGEDTFLPPKPKPEN